MIVKKPLVYAVLYALLGLLIVCWINPYYIWGDQEHYRAVYNGCFFDSYNLENQWDCYIDNTGSKEPIYFFIVKFAQLFINKNTFIIIADTLFIFLIALLVFKNYKAVWHRHLFMLLVLSNYYMAVLLFAAERLKFGFIFLVAALLIQTPIRRLGFIVLSMVTHTQMTMLLAPYFVSRVFGSKGGIFKKVLAVAIPLVLFGVMYYFLRGHIESKLIALENTTKNIQLGWIASLKTSVFIILAAFSLRKIQPLIAGSPLIFAAYFLGSDRTAILAFILYVAYVLYYKQRMDIILFVVMCYFSYKSIGFVSNIIHYGNGYYNIS